MNQHWHFRMWRKKKKASKHLLPNHLWNPCSYLLPLNRLWGCGELCTLHHWWIEILFLLFFFFTPHTHNQFWSVQKKMSCQILYNNLSSCPRKWSPYNTHHREAKDTQVKSTLKSRLSTNQTLSNRLLGAVRCLVLSSDRGEPGCVWWNRKHKVHSAWVQTKGQTWCYTAPGPPSRRPLSTGVPLVKRGPKTSPGRSNSCSSFRVTPESSERERRIHSRFTGV